MADLSVKFEEPTVGGLTGTQLSLLRQWEEEELCAAEIFPVSPKGPAERCMEPNVSWSPYCVDHLREEDDPSYYDDYDCYVDRKNE